MDSCELLRNARHRRNANPLAITAGYSTVPQVGGGLQLATHWQLQLPSIETQAGDKSGPHSTSLQVSHGPPPVWAFAVAISVTTPASAKHNDRTILKRDDMRSSCNEKTEVSWSRAGATIFGIRVSQLQA
jgi:hypothetical protein